MTQAPPPHTSLCKAEAIPPGAIVLICTRSDHRKVCYRVEDAGASARARVLPCTPAERIFLVRILEQDDDTRPANKR
jgi:hypothetical protein